MPIYEPACWSWTGPTEFPGDEDSHERWLAVEAWHEKRCAVCGRKQLRLVEDHDHYTGLTRGWLCQGCNIAEGMSHISGVPVWHLYREKSPAKIWRMKSDYLGVEYPISDPDALIALHRGLLTKEQVRNGERVPERELAWIDNAAMKLGL